MDPDVAAWALMGIGELIGMRWVLWDEEGAGPAQGARPDVPEDVFEEMMQFIERALAPAPGATPAPPAAPPLPRKGQPHEPASQHLHATGPPRSRSVAEPCTPASGVRRTRPRRPSSPCTG